MEMISAVTCNIRKSPKYIYSTEVREYRVTKYRIRYSPRSWQCTVFDSPEEALVRLTIEHKGGWVESYETTETEILHHRYTREGR